ncbi:uncharacterized protein LOC130164710 isoform X2 [Seriola aureovittata]|uniref:uncharacterized protein LOC130164710 isoform X2 n=1 Tax=Seriola aureovittata TaxID=2871759 RepID=UPI0024BEDF9A|nr:uncharacterized protein LOC130164710 isoform X2 [Seriola aureovittata]
MSQRYYLNEYQAGRKYHGLMNQGATCYLNSVLQVLFMTKGFREAVERYTSGNPDPERIDYQLKGLFDDLKKGTACTYNITQKLGIHRVYEQRDAAKFFDKILTLTSPEASQIFCGKLTHETRCSECGTITDTNGPSWHLPLALGDSRRYSVVHGIEEFFKESHISGENQLFCDHCDAKADATVKCVIKHHPEVLMLLLKRFEFNYRYKNNCDVDFPRTLQIPENQTYELYAVVDHVGDLRGGHYTARVKSEDDDRWYNFNDARVSLLHYQPFQVDNSERSRSVYLLFYRKKKTHTADTCTQDIKEVPTSGGLVPAAADNHDQSHDAGKIREGEESGETVEVGNDTADDVSNDRNGETGIRDKVSVVSGGVALSHGSICNVHQQDSGADVNQRRSQSHQGWEEGGSGSDQGYEQQREERRDAEGDKKQKRGVYEPAHRTCYLSSETLLPAAGRKYHGLMNQGATCYLNSVLQVLFMTKGFREAVERYTSGNPDTKRVDYQLKGLFDDLKKRTAYTHNITQKLGIHRVYEQRDAAKFFDEILTLTSPEASQIFCGKLTHETRCSECGTITDTNGPSWHLPLALGDSHRYSVVHGIQEFFKESHISGENQLYCDHCDAKADATVKCVIKHHPEVLMLLLKRFEFNYRYKTYVKNNCDVDVPRTLQIPENQTYELYAVVDHFGGLRGGHYTARVKSEDDERWYHFNDARVSLLDYQPFQVDNSERSWSVYLLFYRKKKTHTADTCTAHQWRFGPCCR